ncbi:MAG: tetratricopeptide repeat protein [Bacteroidota bacterium]
MKKLAVVLMLAAAGSAVAQKDIKPSLPKAEKALFANKLDEAKSIIDITVSSQEFMVDKKGNPSKNAAKAWYLKGLVYAAIDTTKNEQFKSLEANPFSVAKEAFDKCNEIDGGKTGSFVNDPVSGFPLLPDQVNVYLAQAYFNKAISAYQNDKDYKKAFEYTEQTLYFIPEDTSIIMNAGVFFAPAAGETDKSIAYLNKYIEKGGKNQDAYLILFDNYVNKKKDNAMALKVIQEAKKLFPDNAEFPKYELNIYLNEKKYDVAKTMVEASIKENPNDKESYFLLGQLHEELKEVEAAKAAYNKALSLDPKYYDAAAKIANFYWLDAKAVKDEMGKLGNTKADMAKMQQLDKDYVEKLKVAIPYLEACEKISPDELNILYLLLGAYQDLDVQPSIARVKKRLKALGEEVD